MSDRKSKGGRVVKQRVISLIEEVSESALQTRIVTELARELNPDIFFAAIPNGDLRAPSVAARLKASGVKGGPTDLFFVAPDGVSAWMEVKTPKAFKGRDQGLSDAQMGFQSVCRRNQHLHAVVCSVEGAIQACRDWDFLKKS